MTVTQITNNAQVPTIIPILAALDNSGFFSIYIILFRGANIVISGIISFDSPWELPLALKFPPEVVGFLTKTSKLDKLFPIGISTSPIKTSLSFSKFIEIFLASSLLFIGFLLIKDKEYPLLLHPFFFLEFIDCYKYLFTIF